MQTHHGSCHCQSVSFSFKQADAIERGVRCNCSICSRKGAVMSMFTLSPEQINITANDDVLGLYEFDNKVANHFFCKTCGIYPFHQMAREPGQYRVNLGCVDEVDTDSLEVMNFDGKSL